MFELRGVNYYKKHCQIQGELDLVRVSEEFELAGDYCISLTSHLQNLDMTNVIFVLSIWSLHNFSAISY